MKKSYLLILLSFLIVSQGYSAFVTKETKAKNDEVVMNPNAETAVPNAETVNAAMKEFKNLSRHERKERLKNVKKEISELKAQKKAGEASTNTVLLVILAILLPPLAVYLHEGTINGKFWLSLLLTLLFFLPGVIYALLVVLGSA